MKMFNSLSEKVNILTFINSAGNNYIVRKVCFYDIIYPTRQKNTGGEA